MEISMLIRTEKRRKYPGSKFIKEMLFIGISLHSMKMIQKLQ
jgi:hypothetical protein